VRRVWNTCPRRQITFQSDAKTYVLEDGLKKGREKSRNEELGAVTETKGHSSEKICMRLRQVHKLKAKGRYVSHRCHTCFSVEHISFHKSIILSVIHLRQNRLESTYYFYLIMSQYRKNNLQVGGTIRIIMAISWSLHEQKL
jgi:hypothetical protein